MKKAIALALAAGALAAFGCTTMSPEKKYQADSPPKLEKASPGRTDLPPTPLSDARNRVSPEINSDNYLEEARRLENTMRDEGRAMSKAGR